MKTITALLLLLIMSIGNINGIDTESYHFVEHLLRMGGPQGPQIFEDGVIFTAPSSYRRVGVAFAHEGFAKVHWFRKLVMPEDNMTALERGKKEKEPTYLDSGIQFHAYTVPPELKELEYRMIIDGLWTIDPENPVCRVDAAGLAHSILSIPPGKKTPSTFDAPSGSLFFRYTGASGEVITVAGSFNGWDPFMYELKERTAGEYALVLPLPPGTYYYVFFHRGQRILDPNNHNRAYTRDGKIASKAVIQ